MFQCARKSTVTHIMIFFYNHHVQHAQNHAMDEPQQQKNTLRSAPVIQEQGSETILGTDSPKLDR